MLITNRVCLKINGIVLNKKFKREAISTNYPLTPDEPIKKARKMKRVVGFTVQLGDRKVKTTKS